MYLEVDPRQLRFAAAEVSALQDRVQSVFNDLRSDVASRGTSWQHGSFGTAFADEYLDAEEKLFHTAHNLAATLGNFSFAMSKASDEFTAADSAPRVAYR